ncbi:MAG: hypothetical protein PHU01_05320 [Desulfuromonadaceae bacterium]|nr:hypothetical protein [Desulfuromonadaceae bacterium]
MSSVNNTKAAPSYALPQAKPVPEQIAKDPDAYRNEDPGKTYSLSLKNAELGDVLMLLSKESGTTIVSERNMRGMVQIEAKNKKLGEILYEILKPLGYTAAVENGMILVGRPRLTTRTFHMNYLKDTRNSSSNMNVSGFASAGSGSVSVSTTGKSDYWGALESSLEMFVFGKSGIGKREGGGYIAGESEKKADDGLKGKDNSKVTTQELNDPFLSNTQINNNLLKQLVVNEMAGIIQITDYPENLDRIASFLSDVEEGSKRQVLIQAHIMEVSLRDSFSLGIDWKVILDKSTNLVIGQSLTPNTMTNVFTLSSPQTLNPLSNPYPPVGTDGITLPGHWNNFSILIDAMKEQGNVRMLSSPKISALNNQKAVIKLTTKQVSWISTKTTQSGLIGTDTYTTTPQIDEVGIFLDVTPQIGSNGSIIMQIHPSISEIKVLSVSPDKTSTKPIIDIREIDTMVDAKNGETIVIAGLISDKLNETRRSVPLLGEIPYLGALFSYNFQERNKTELVIMMTPYVLNNKNITEIREDHEKRMQNMGGDFHLINNMGSMITEKSSRDWIMRSEPHRIQPVIEQERNFNNQQSSVTDLNKSDAIDKYVQKETKVDSLKKDSIVIENRTESNKIEETAKPAKEQKEINAQVIEKNRNIKSEAYSVTKYPEAEPRLKNDDKQEYSTSSSSDVQTVSVTTAAEQTLYRSAVSAYKIGDCRESIKVFDNFLKAYPNSPFSADAAYYRKDCSERISANTIQR